METAKIKEKAMVTCQDITEGTAMPHVRVPVQLLSDMQYYAKCMKTYIGHVLPMNGLSYEDWNPMWEMCKLMEMSLKGSIEMGEAAAYKAGTAAVPENTVILLAHTEEDVNRLMEAI